MSDIAKKLTCAAMVFYEYKADDGAILREAADEINRLNDLINTPELNDFQRGVLIEAVHQRERWPEGHDAQKGPSDWIRLLVHLTAKIGTAEWDGDYDKMKHHVITLAAVANNFHSAILQKENKAT